MMDNHPAPEHRSLPSLIAALCRTIDRELSPGDVAALRRLRPEDPSQPAFWRMAALYLAPSLPDSGPRRDDLERRWAVILQALAELQGLYDPRTPLGRALARSDMAEMRALKLLRSNDSALHDLVRICAQHLANKANGANLVELALLVLTDGGDRQESVRRQIARDFYSELQSRQSA